MSRRLDIELTSAPDGATFTWRAAGARQPKGTVPAATLPGGASVGDVLKVEIDVGLDGTEITQVIPGRTSRQEPERIELHSAPIDEAALVTSKLAPKGKGRPRRDRSDRSDRPDRGRKVPGGNRGRSDRPDRTDSTRGAADGAARKPRAPRRSSPPPTPERPKAPRLRARRVHRTEVLESLAPEQRAVAEQVLRGGLAGVRQGIETENAQRREKGEAEVKVEGIVALAEGLLPRLRIAEWHDRADAALAAIDDVDLRDLRSVVVAADDNAKDETTRALAAELREKLAARVDRAQRDWLSELGTALDEKRIVRAIKLSSRPPKAGSPLPADLATRIVDAATAALTPDAGQGRWVAIIDALAFSPVRLRVVPAALPAEPSPELLALMTRVATRLPELAARFGIDPASVPQAASRSRGGAGRSRRPGGRKGGAGAAGSPRSEGPKVEAATSPEQAPVDPVAPSTTPTEASSAASPAAEEAPPSDSPASPSDAPVRSSEPSVPEPEPSTPEAEPGTDDH